MADIFGADLEMDLGDATVVLRGVDVVIDAALSSTSKNPVQNRVVKAALDLKADESALARKQDKLTAGQNVTISDDVISADVDSAEIAANVTDWLDTNVNPTGSAVVVDSSLTVSGAAADAKVTGDNITEIHDELSSGELDITYVQKGWQNGVGFVDQDSAMSAGEVLYSGLNGVTIETDFSRYRVSLYFFTSPTNKYPHFEGHYHNPVTIPPNQYFAFFIVYRTGLVTLTDEDIDRIPDVTHCLKNIGVWNAVRSAAEAMHPQVVAPYNRTIRDYALETQIQDAFINHESNVLYQFTGAGADVSDYAGHIIRIGLNNMQMTDNVYHRLGHAGCLGYIQQTDTLFMGRVLSGVPVIQIYRDFCEAAIDNAVLSPSDENCVSISLNSAVLKGKTSFDVTLGERDNILYCLCTKISEYKNSALIYRLLLGTGSTDLSSETNGYGNFVSAADGEYNGTCQILEEWNLPAVNRQPQLIRWHNGVLYMMTSNKDTIIHKYRYIDGVFYTDELIYINDLDASGNVVRMEAESLMFVDSGLYLTLWDKATPTRMRLLGVEI